MYILYELVYMSMYTGTVLRAGVTPSEVTALLRQGGKDAVMPMLTRCSSYLQSYVGVMSLTITDSQSDPIVAELADTVPDSLVDALRARSSA